MAGSFTAVDLSRLPAPPIVEVIDFEVILAEMLGDLRARDPSFDALVESDPAYKILEVAAYREVIVRQRVNDAARGVMLAYARGGDLDQLGALPGVSRLVLSPGDPERSIPPTMETDEDFRRRIQLAPEGYSVAGPEGAYTFHALSADARVLDASATSPTPGAVVVSILSREGDGTAAQDLIDAVAAKLAADDVRPLTDHVTVQSAGIVPFTVEAVIYTFAGPDASVVMAEANSRLQSYLAASHRMGRDVTLSGLYAALHAEGVQRVDLTSPVADVVVDRTDATYCTAVQVTHGGIDE
jgi:phage-related baseplate assembly protein